MSKKLNQRMKNLVKMFEGFQQSEPPAATHVREGDCGITTAHIKAIESTMKELDCFLFARPTELDSTLLIKNGFATKSMDIHDKSSNWGPMAGCVPCDPAFSKKQKGNPDPTKRGEPHGDASPLHLYITENLRLELEQKNKMKFISGKANVANQVRYVAAKGPVKAEKFNFCLRKSGANWKVYWLNESRGGSEEELFVWGYNGVPVTGDYDLYMVCPHLRWWKLHSHVLNVQDSHGKSAATLFNTWLLRKLNVSCNRVDKPVFHHGAESQNYGFTQGLDKELAMFTPAGTSRMVPRKEIPKVLADVEAANYLVIWNKRYGEKDPRLSGQTSPAEKAFQNRTKAAMIKQRSERIAETETVLEDRGKQKFQSLVWKAYSNKLVEDSIANVKGISAWKEETAKIKEFNDELKCHMEQRSLEPRALNKKDFGENYVVLDRKFHDFQRQLEQKLVAVTEGGGGSALKALDAWFESNLEMLFTMSEGIGEVPSEIMGLNEKDFILNPHENAGEGENFYDRG